MRTARGACSFGGTRTAASAHCCRTARRQARADSKVAQLRHRAWQPADEPGHWHTCSVLLCTRLQLSGSASQCQPAPAGCPAQLRTPTEDRTGGCSSHARMCLACEHLVGQAMPTRMCWARSPAAGAVMINALRPASAQEHACSRSQPPPPPPSPCRRAAQCAVRDPPHSSHTKAWTG